MPTLTIPGVPVPQPRQRVAVIGGRARTYTPARDPVNVFKAAVQLAFMQTCPNWRPLDEPVWLRCLFVLPKPASRVRKRDGGQRTRCATRPDVDNIGKAVMDALNGLAWTDDSRISQLELTKCYAGQTELPHVHLEFGSYTEDADQ